MQVLCVDRQQHAGADSGGDGDGEDDSPREPGGAGTVLHLQHHPHAVLHGHLQGLTHTITHASTLAYPYINTRTRGGILFKCRHYSRLSSDITLTHIDT